MPDTTRLALSAILLLAPAGAMAEAVLEGAGQTTTIDCDGGPAIVRGAGNTITFTGPCAGLTVEGAGNRITIDLAERSGITVRGASNRIQYRAPAAAKPRIALNGAGNSAARLK